jgi:serine/threonine protein kinase
MGTVYLAERADGAFEQEVALKLVRGGVGSVAMLQRFLRERQILARLEHPNIARLLDGGLSEEGSPYFAMELVRGTRITAHCDARRSSIEERLQLFDQACGAVQYAHANLVIHRDLKPSNMLVTEDGSLKLLDFGIAKILSDTEEAGGAGLTRTGGLALTPDYAAPEQWHGQAATAATDVYALGVVLYELLCGRRPGWSLTEAWRRGASENLEPLAAVLARGAIARLEKPGPAPAEIAAARSTSVPRLRRIVAQALQPDPQQRYQSVQELADDLARFLAGHPVRARGASPSYRLKKWLRRHRAALAVGLSSAAVVVVLAGLARVFSPPQPAERGIPSAEFGIVSDPAQDHDQGSFSPDGSQIAFVRADTTGVRQVWTRPLERDEPVQLTRGPPAALGPRWAARDGRLVFYRPGAGIWSYLPLDGPLRQLRPRGMRPDLAADGSRLVFVDDGRIWLADGDGDGAAALPGVERHYFSWMDEPVLSPDARTIAFFLPDPLRPLGDLWLVPAAGGALRQLTHLSFAPGGLAWTPDGRRIVFSSDHGGAQTLWRVSVDGGALQPITTGSGEDTNPSVSPDGQRILYTSTRNVYALSRLDPATGRRSTLLERRRPIVLPYLSPEGNRVAFFSRTADGVHLFTQAEPAPTSSPATCLASAPTAGASTSCGPTSSRSGAAGSTAAARSASRPSPVATS